jgi:hypothetical protein
VHSILTKSGFETLSARLQKPFLLCPILKQYRNLTYEELAFHLEGSQSFPGLCKCEWSTRSLGDA